ncbi:MAG: TetR family transcriptional regulator C-terminal domain-containing protein [Streptosporangiales bacterium]
MEELGQRVRYAIDSTGTSQRQLASAIDMDPTKLSKSLAGTRRFQINELTAIADEAGVSLGWLLHGAGPTPAPTTSRSRRSADRRVEILEAAWRLAAQRGVHNVRVADIAKACGTSPAAIHYYFPGKQNVIHAALLHCAEAAFTRQSMELDQLTDARERMLRLIDLQVPALGQVRDEWMIWLQVSAASALNSELRHVHNDFYRRWRDTVADTIRLGQQQGRFRDADPQRTAVAFMSLADGLAIQILTATPGNSVETMRERLLELAGREIFLPDT